MNTPPPQLLEYFDACTHARTEREKIFTMKTPKTAFAIVVVFSPPTFTPLRALWSFLICEFSFSFVPSQQMLREVFSSSLMKLPQLQTERSFLKEYFKRLQIARTELGREMKTIQAFRVPCCIIYDPPCKSVVFFSYAQSHAWQMTMIAPKDPP